MIRVIKIWVFCCSIIISICFNRYVGQYGFVGGVIVGILLFEIIDIDEVKEFYFLIFEEDKVVLFWREFKCSFIIVFVDFFIRYGLIMVQGDEVDYVEVNMWLY